MSRRIRLISTLLIGGLLAYWMASQVARGDYLLIIPVILFFVAVGILGRLFPNCPRDGALLIVAVCMIMITGKGFVYLSLGRILFVSEIILGVLVAFYMFRVVWKLWEFLPPTPMALPCILFFVYATLHLIWDIPRYGFFALRDAPTVYYLGFFLASYQLAANEEFRNMALKAICIAAIPTVIVMAAMRVFPYLIQEISAASSLQGVPTFRPHVDAGDFTFSGSIAFLFQLLLNNYKSKALIYGLLLFLFGMVLSFARGTLYVSSGVLTLFMVFSGKIKKILPLMIMGLLLAGVFLILMSNIDLSRNERVNRIYDEFLSFVAPFDSSVSGKGAGTANWRIELWRFNIEKTIQENIIFGRGLGVDIITEFFRWYYRAFLMTEDQAATRGAHNAAVTIFARLGLVGFILFSWITVVQIQYFLKAIRMWRENDSKMDPKIAFIWGGIVNGFVTTFFQYTWEAPYSAMPFWVMSGIAYYHVDQYFLVKRKNRLVLT